jgi:hypothetical protein
LQVARHHDKEALPENRSQAVEGAAYAYKPGLLVFVKAEHVEAVGRYVVGRAAEGHQPEEAQRALQPEVGGYGERYAAKRRADE